MIDALIKRMSISRVACLQAGTGRASRRTFQKNGVAALYGVVMVKCGTEMFFLRVDLLGNIFSRPKRTLRTQNLKQKRETRCVLKECKKTPSAT